MIKKITLLSYPEQTVGECLKQCWKPPKKINDILLFNFIHIHMYTYIYSNTHTHLYSHICQNCFEVFWKSKFPSPIHDFITYTHMCRQTNPIYTLSLYSLQKPKPCWSTPLWKNFCLNFGTCMGIPEHVSRSQQKYFCPCLEMTYKGQNERIIWLAKSQ